MAKLTKKEEQRRLGLISTLEAMSRDGWLSSCAGDWQPLERELRELNDKAERARRAANAANQLKHFRG